MPPLKDRIIQALYGGTLVTVSLGTLTACGVDELPNERDNNANRTNATNSGTSTAKTSMTNVMPPKAEVCGAERYERLDYEKWRAQVNRGDGGRPRYVVCQGPSSRQKCDDSSGWSPQEKETFVWEALSEPNGRCDNNPSNVGYYDEDGSATFCGAFDWQGETCCHVIDLSFAYCIEGRPFTVEGIARQAHVVERQGWTEGITLTGVEQLPDSLRQEIAAHWAQSGVHEHASVASFGRFLLDLMSLGAPRRLVAAATKAIDDEIRHASACFAIASVYAQRPLGPGKVDMAGSMSQAGDAAQILEAAILEGCIGETLAASVASWLASRVGDEGMGGVLGQIAEEESEHALLSWEAVQWLLQTHRELVPRAREVFAKAFEPQQGGWAQGIGEAERVTILHGKVRPGTEDHLRRRAYHEIVLPCAEALFESLEKKEGGQIQQEV